MGAGVRIGCLSGPREEDTRPGKTPDPDARHAAPELVFGAPKTSHGASSVTPRSIMPWCSDHQSEDCPQQPLGEIPITGCAQAFALISVRRRPGRSRTAWVCASKGACAVRCFRLGENELRRRVAASDSVSLPARVSAFPRAGRDTESNARIKRCPFLRSPTSLDAPPWAARPLASATGCRATCAHHDRSRTRSTRARAESTTAPQRRRAPANRAR